MDSKDREILDFLEEDGRASYTNIAESIGVSEGTVRNRVERMEKEGIIDKFTVEVSTDSEVKAFVHVNVSTSVNFESLTEELPEDIEVSEVAGDIDLIVKISRRTADEVNNVVDSIRSLEGVEDTRTYMVLSDHT